VPITQWCPTSRQSWIGTRSASPDPAAPAFQHRGRLAGDGEVLHQQAGQALAPGVAGELGQPFPQLRGQRVATALVGQSATLNAPTCRRQPRRTAGGEVDGPPVEVSGPVGGSPVGVQQEVAE